MCGWLTVSLAVICTANIDDASSSTTRQDATATKVQTKETVICKMPTDASDCVVSPDGKHIAFVVKRDNGQAVVLDGADSRVYDRVLPHTLAFSGDSRRFGFVAERGKKQFAVVDGTDGTAYEDLPEIPPIFSPDGKRVATVGSRKGKRLVVVDGVEGSDYDSVYFDSLAFSPDGKRMAYAARKRGKCVVIVDGVETQPFDTPMAVETTPDGKYVVYASGDGQEGTLPFLVFNPAWVEKGMGAFKYSIVPFLAFSPDGKRLAYIARDKKEVFFVVDGVAERKGYHGILLHNRTSPYQPVNRKRAREREGAYGIPFEGNVSPFSPDSRRLGYIAVRFDSARKQSIMSCVVVDGKEIGEPYISVDLHFSPDSKRIAYVHTSNTGQMVVVDGVEYRHDGVPWEALCFSPDSKHASYLARTGNEHARAIDGETGKSYGELLGFGPCVYSPDSKHMMEMIVRKDESMVVVTDGVEGKAYDKVRLAGFTPDSKHAAYFGTRLGSTCLVVDGVEGKRFDAVFSGDDKVQADGTVCFFGFSNATKELTRVVTQIAD